MKAIFSVGGHVPRSRVLREHRAALAPLAIVLAINVMVLIAVVLPLTRGVASNQQRAETAERVQATAEAEFKQAEGLREGQARASADLETFYKDVLPASAAAARRITHLKLQQRARAHNLRYERGATNDDELKDSELDRQTILMSLSGDYDDVRGFIYELETSPDFVVIADMVLSEDADANARLSLSLELSTYYRGTRTAAARTGANGR